MDQYYRDRLFRKQTKNGNVIFKTHARTYLPFLTFVLFNNKNLMYILHILKRPVYIFAFGVYNSKQVNVSGIRHYVAQM